MSVGNFLESLSQAILVGIILAGRLGGMRTHCEKVHASSPPPAGEKEEGHIPGMWTSLLPRARIRRLAPMPEIPASVKLSIIVVLPVSAAFRFPFRRFTVSVLRLFFSASRCPSGSLSHDTVSKTTSSISRAALRRAPDLVQMGGLVRVGRHHADGHVLRRGRDRLPDVERRRQPLRGGGWRLGQHAAPDLVLFISSHSL